MTDKSEAIAPVRGRFGRLAIIGAAALAVLGGGAWWQSRKSASADQALIVGDQRGGVQALLKAAGELDHVPYKIEWALFPAASPLLEALNSGAIDIGGVGGQPFAFAYASGAKIKAVYASRATPHEGRGRCSAVLVSLDSPLKRFEDIKGHRLATVKGSAGQDLALQLLETHGLKPNDVKWVYLNNAEAKAALGSGAVDAWSTWGAYVGYGLLKGHQRSLADAQELKPQPGFYAANDKAISGKHALIEDFIKRLSRARVWIGTHQDEYAAVLAKETGLPVDVARFTVDDLITSPVPVNDELAKDEQAILDRYKRAGLIDKVPDLKGAFDSSFNTQP